MSRFGFAFARRARALALPALLLAGTPLAAQQVALDGVVVDPSGDPVGIRWRP